VNVLPDKALLPPAGPGIAAQAADEARRWRVGVAAIGETHHGTPVGILRRLADNARLLVAGTRCPSDRVEPPNPSVTRRVLEHAACPVLVAHGPSRAPAPRLAAP
jgi:nucleotide-binding universal stress UspA family protein